MENAPKNGSFNRKVPYKWKLESAMEKNSSLNGNLVGK